MKQKVLLDTCILVAASTYAVSRDWSIRLEHPFYIQATELIALFRRNIEKRIGIVTRTIEKQAPLTLENAIKSELQRKKIKDREVDFELFSAIHNSCDERLSDILASLLTEPVDEEAVYQNYFYVDKMYERMAEEAVHRLVESRAAKWTRAAARRFRKVAGPIYKERVKKEDFQLFNLIRKPVENSDKRILAEAIYLSMLYNRTETEDADFYICSTDYHFSPKRWRGEIESRQVTDKIKEKFNITCDWPQQIKEVLESKLKGLRES